MPSVFQVTQKCARRHCAAPTLALIINKRFRTTLWTGWWLVSPNLAMISDGKKFMWDGQLYDTREEASRTGESYRNDDFEVQMVEEGGKFLVYTRRTLKQVVVTAQ